MAGPAKTRVWLRARARR